MKTARSTFLSSALPSDGIPDFRFENGPDDRAVAREFSIRKRSIHRFGPSDCSASCLGVFFRTLSKIQPIDVGFKNIKNIRSDYSGATEPVHWNFRQQLLGHR